MKNISFNNSGGGYVIKPSQPSSAIFFLKALPFTGNLIFSRLTVAVCTLSF